MLPESPSAMALQLQPSEEETELPLLAPPPIGWPPSPGPPTPPLGLPAGLELVLDDMEAAPIRVLPTQSTGAAEMGPSLFDIGTPPVQPGPLRTLSLTPREGSLPAVSIEPQMLPEDEGEHIPEERPALRSALAQLLPRVEPAAVAQVAPFRQQRVLQRARCPPQEECARLPSATRLAGQQGAAYVGCPDARSVIKYVTARGVAKIFPALRADPEALASQMVRNCDAMEALNTLIDTSPIAEQFFVPTYACCVQGGAQPLQTAWQARAEGEPLADWLRSRAASARDLQFVLLQALEAVDQLFRAGLYHNDLHAGNVLVGAVRPVALALGAPAAQVVLAPRVTLIDYNLLSKGAPLSASYGAGARGDAPLVDICQLYSSVAHLSNQAKRPDLIEAADELLEPDCAYIGSPARSSIVLRPQSVYAQTIARARTALYALVPPAPL